MWTKQGVEGKFTITGLLWSLNFFKLFYKHEASLRPNGASALPVPAGPRVYSY